MMNPTLIALILVFSLSTWSASGQVLTGGNVFLQLGSGFLYGQSEIMGNDAHYNQSVYSFRDYRGGWFGAKSETWQRKYSSLLPGAKTVFVWTTDSYHFARTGSRFLAALSGVQPLPDRRLTPLVFLVRFVAFSVGFHASYLLTCPNCKT